MSRRSHNPKRGILLSILTLFLGLLLFPGTRTQASPVPQSENTPQASPTFDNLRLEQPPTVIPPAQVDKGEQLYWSICMCCHGDNGQGLTDEWRDSYDTDRDCWKSGCHGPDTNSFELNRESPVPALSGAGTLARFDNAFELKTYIYANMPWWNPGSITQNEAWSVSNYLLKLNETRPNDLILNNTNAHAIPVHRTVTLPEPEWPGVLVLSSVLVLAAIGISKQVKSKIVTLPKPNFIHHLHPPSIPAAQSEFRYTLAAGGLAIFLSLILFVTGVLEMYFYIPSPEHAATSVQVITTLVPFGNLIRNLHYWSAQILLIVITIHLLRVVLTGAYVHPRRFNFLLGLGLMVFILLLDFTGYALRWDEGIRWALVVGTNLLKTIPSIGEGLYHFVMGGTDIGPAALTRFYAWHVFGLTSGAVILTIWHAFRVRRDGGIAVPPPTARGNKNRISRFELVHREILAMVIAGAVLLLIAVLIPAPIDQPITDANLDTSDSRAPWFFLWIQQLLKYGDPFIWGVLIPILILVVLGLIPYILPTANPESLGSWFPKGNRIAQALTVIIILVLLVLTFIGALK